MSESIFTSQRVGNIKFFFNGRIAIGPDWRVMLVPLISLLIGSLLYSCYTNTITAFRIIIGIFGPISILLLCLCGMRNPGLCPKELPPPITAPPREPLEVVIHYKTFSGMTVSEPAELKWCYSCNMYRPLRAVHCRFCDVCVCRREHHCPWSSLCIGAHNYLPYFCFLWCTFAVVFVAFCGSIASLTVRGRVVSEANTGSTLPPDDKPNAFLGAVAQTYGIELILLIVCVPWALMTGTLACFHTKLALNNMTTIDEHRLATGQPNRYNTGSYLGNLRASFFPPEDVLWRESGVSRGDVMVTVEVEGSGSSDGFRAESGSDFDDGPAVTRSAADRVRRGAGGAAIVLHSTTYTPAYIGTVTAGPPQVVVEVEDAAADRDEADADADGEVEGLDATVEPKEL